MHRHQRSFVIWMHIDIFVVWFQSDFIFLIEKELLVRLNIPALVACFERPDFNRKLLDYLYFIPLVHIIKIYMKKRRKKEIVALWSFYIWKIHKAFTMMKWNGRPVEVLTEKLILCLKFSIFNGFVETVAPSQQEEEEEHLQLKNKGSKHTVNGAGG